MSDRKVPNNDDNDDEDEDDNAENDNDNVDEDDDDDDDDDDDLLNKFFPWWRNSEAQWMAKATLFGEYPKQYSLFILNTWLLRPVVSLLS